MRFLLKKQRWLLILGLALIARGCLWHSSSQQTRILYDTMADLCDEEAVLFNARDRDCRERDADDIPWDDPSEESATLKICPDPMDPPNYDSWKAQGEVWRRASARAHNAASRYHSRAERQELFGW